MTRRPTAQPAFGYGALLKENRNYRYLWFGQIVSLLGDWFNLVASASLVGLLTQSGLAVGSVFVVRMLAPFVVNPIAGVVADRYSRKRILITADLLRAASVLCFLFVRDAGDIWLLYALIALQMALSGFFDPAHTSILPDVAGPEQLGAANAVSSATWSVMLALGAALGGLFSGTFGMYPAFVLDAFTFLLSAALLAQIRVPKRPASEMGEKTVGAAVREYIYGLRFLGANPDILVAALQKAMLALFLATAFQVIQVAIAQRFFTIGEGGGISMGMMFALTGVGSGIVEKGDRGRLRRRHRRRCHNRASLQPADGPAGLAGACARQRGYMGLFDASSAADGARRSARPGLCQRLYVLLPRQRAFVECNRRRPGHDGRPARARVGRRGP